MNDTYDILRNVRDRLLRVMGTAYLYSWTPEFIDSEIKDCYDKTIAEITTESLIIDLQSLKYEELLDLGFRQWSDKTLMLVPIWLVPIVRENKDQIFTAIDNETFTFGDNPTEDLDHRMGLVSWGIARNTEGE